MRPGRPRLSLVTEGSACDCQSDLYRADICDEPVEVYIGEDLPVVDDGYCHCAD